MQLLIDTIQKGQMIFELWDNDVRLAGFKKITAKLSEEILPELQKFLKKNKINFGQIDKILVNPGPGSFSSTRTGVAVANALSLALNIPIAEWPASLSRRRGEPSGKIKEVVLPIYDREPNITKSPKMSF